MLLPYAPAFAVLGIVAGVLIILGYNFRFAAGLAVLPGLYVISAFLTIGSPTGFVIFAEYCLIPTILYFIGGGKYTLENYIKSKFR